MGYKSILEEIKEFYHADLTMDSLKELSSIAKKANKVYERSAKKNKNDAKIHYDLIMEYLNRLVFEKLKDTLHFRDEVINKIMHFINLGDRLINIYVFDGNVVTRAKARDDDDQLLTYFVPDESFYEITSNDFADLSSNQKMKKNLINAINNTIGPLFNSDNIIKLDNNKITCNIPKLTIYVDGTNTRLLVKYGDRFFYYNAILLENRLILTHNEKSIFILTEMLDDKKKTK